MAAQQTGLRPVQTDNIRNKYERGVRPTVNTENRDEQLRPVAAPVSRYSAPAAIPQDRRLEQLADALANVNPALQRYGAMLGENKEKEQAAKLPAYLEQIKRDRGTGAITAAQVGEIFPEMVPTIRWRVAQAIGEEAGQEAFNPIIEEINNNENLRFDTEARKAFIEKKRAELFAKIGGGNDFYEAGFVGYFDKALSQWEGNWQRATAEKHREIMGNQWQREVQEAFINGGPDALLRLDDQWKESGGLHHTTRNALLIKTITDAAYENDNPALLDAIPQRFLNRESKIAIAEGKAKIEEHRKAQLRWQMTMQDYQRGEQVRGAKIDALNKFFNGETIHPGMYRQNPEVADYVTSLLNRPRVNPVASEARAQTIRNEVLKAATFGDLSRLGVSGDVFNQEGLVNMILEDPNLNGQEAQALIKEVPKLLQGVALLRDDDVRQQIGDRLRPLLDSLNQSIPGGINRTLGGKSLYAQGMDTFQKDLQRQFIAYYETNGDWPKGFEKNDMIEASLTKAEAMVLKLADPKNIQQTVTDSKAKPSAAPAKPSREASGKVGEVADQPAAAPATDQPTRRR